ncbi:MAG TPA: twin-arginine translocation signal domain-containing protein, partial [Gemmatimonadales bacterium]|nr:twin-arginine translocation signal domain-containing protein [Gemmatimonadales bacterium]
MAKDDRNEIDPRIWEMLRGGMGRRQFINRSAMAAGGLAIGSSLLSACAPKEGAKPAADTTKAMAAGGSKEVRISNWPLYIDSATVTDFEKATGIKATYTEDINDNNEF